jgi:hypothetical protein
MYGALKRQFDLDDDYLVELKAELIQGQHLATDEEGEVLLWTGGTDVSPRTAQPVPQPGTQLGAADAPRTPILSVSAAPPSSQGLIQPLQIHRVLHESGAQTRLDTIMPHDLTPLVGRDAVPLLAVLLSLPLPASYALLTLTPQRQRQQTLEVLLAWLHREVHR